MKSAATSRPAWEDCPKGAIFPVKGTTSPTLTSEAAKAVLVENTSARTTKQIAANAVTLILVFIVLSSLL
jgi:hypothetical protein